jgi:hypothetical protein
MFRVFSILFILSIFINRSQAQELLPANGKVEINQDEKISLLADHYRKMSLNNPEIDGYRVQRIRQQVSRANLKLFTSMLNHTFPIKNHIIASGSVISALWLRLLVFRKRLLPTTRTLSR